MRRLLIPSSLSVFCLLAALPVLAGDGAIPIWEPTTITEPGKYVLTRNITTGENALVVESSNVVVDLNGFRVHCDDPDGTTCVYIESGYQNITIENGIVSSSATFGHSIRLDGSSPLRRVTIRNNIITATNEAVTGGPDLYGVVVINNRIRGGAFSALHFNGGEGTEIRHNYVTALSVGGFGVVISENTVPGSAGQGIYFSGHNSRIVDNTVTNAFSNGIAIIGDGNHIEGNQTSANGGYGIWISEIADDNVYRGNTARGNGGTDCTGTASGDDFCDNGTNNTSHGDNYMPVQM